MRRSYRNFNNVGKVGCLLLVLLTFLTINPVSWSAVFAEEGDANSDDAEEVVDENYGENAADYDGVMTDDEVMTLAGTVDSIVGISFSPAAYYKSLSPTTAAGQSARIDISAVISVYNSGGYTVYLKSNSANLVGANHSSIIPGATTAKTYVNMDVNTWGYAKAVGTAVTDSDTYKKVEVSGNGDVLTENKSTNIPSDTRTINLSFAAKINNEKLADTYSNTMMLSVVSSPMKVVAVDFGIETMQEMTSGICANALDRDSNGEITGQLKDIRDGNYYWVSKLADGKCWMTQNLALDLSTSRTLTTIDSDVTTDWTPGYTTATKVSNNQLKDNAGQRSWNLGSYYIKSPNGSTSCGSDQDSLAGCSPTYFTALATPTSANNNINAHWLAGNYYQWCAATAGCTNSSGQTGGKFNSGEAVSSICPKGWRLPTATTVGDFSSLFNAYSIASDANGVTKLVSSPLYFVKGGSVVQDTFLLYEPAYSGRYWSSSVPTSSSSTYFLYFSNGGVANPSISNFSRYTGFSVRCIAR